MNFLLPFKLLGSRIKKQQRSNSFAMESEVEKNEQSIEYEFLRLFDYARCLSLRLCYITAFVQYSPTAQLFPDPSPSSTQLFRKIKIKGLSRISEDATNDSERVERVVGPSQLKNADLYGVITQQGLLSSGSYSAATSCCVLQREL